jgi:ribosomal protein S18 acetylase RimI-like enzyme
MLAGVLRAGESAGFGARLAGAASTIGVITQRLGWAYALLGWCATFGRRMSLHIFVVTTHRIDHDPENGDVLPAGLEARLLTHDDVLRFFDREAGYSYLRSFAVDALARGDRCVGVLERGSLLWYCWYAKGLAPVFDDLGALADWPFLYAYNAHTHPAHRGRGLHRTGVKASARTFAREGYRAFTAYIEADNLAPLVAASTMSERIVGVVVVHRARGRARWLPTPGCRQGGFRLRRRRDVS